MRTLSKIKPFVIPVGFLIVCFMAYGILAPRLGFYLDDWYIIWFYKMFGASKFVDFFSGDRPLFAYVYMVFVPIFKDSRIGWQLFAVFTRWLAVCSFWYLLKMLLPKQDRLTLAASLLFAVYPGFQFHWFSVMYSQVYVLFTLYFLSYILMAKAINKERNKAAFIAAAMLCQFLGIAPMEYFYGLELFRPLLLFILLTPLYLQIHSRIKQAFLYWIPFLFVFVGFTIFRIVFASSYSYEISLLADLKQSPFSTMLGLANDIFHVLYDSIIRVWVNTLQLFEHDLRSTSSMVMFGLLILGFIVAFFVLRTTKINPDSYDYRVGKCLIGIGLFVTLVSMIPFLFAGFTSTLDFPGNRFLLAMSPGIILLVVGLVEIFIRTDNQKILVISILIGLSISSQFLAARIFMNYWNQQKDFFTQLAWRIPGLEEDTILVTDDLSFSQYFSGNSLTAPLNMIYASDAQTNQIPYLLFLASGGQAPAIPVYQPDQPVDYTFRALDFKGNTSSIVVFTKPESGCFRVLSNQDTPDEFVNSSRSDFWKEVIPLSNLDRIDTTLDGSAVLPIQYFGSPSPEQWCFFYEKADLARQASKWDEVISLYDQAQAKGFSTKFNAEWVPLIEAYVQTGQIEKAIELTRQISTGDKPTEAVLCNLWRDMQNPAASTVEHERIIKFSEELGCQVNH